MCEKKFTIKNYPDDVYKAVGIITANAQDLERDFKKLARLLDIPKINIDNASLNILNDALKTNQHINEKEYDGLKKIIKLRNDINHDFFLSYLEITFESFDKKIELIENELNSAYFYINEAIDLINNKIDKLNGGFIFRRTIFDEVENPPAE